MENFIMDGLKNESVITLAMLHYLVAGVVAKVVDADTAVGTQVETVVFNKIIEKSNALAK